MAVKLNLLPQDYIVSGPLSKALKIVRPLNVILLGIFLASALGMSLYFVLSSVTLNKLNSENSLLKSQINSQKAAQQQIVLLKDRLSKINDILSSTQSHQNLTIVQPLLDGVSENQYVSELTIDTQKIDLVMGFNTNSSLTNFVKTLDFQISFSGVLMNSFNYNPSTGYLVDFSLTGKD